MTAERWAVLKSLFGQAVALDTVAQVQFMQQVQSEDTEIGNGLRSLVQHLDSAPALLEGPLISQQRIVEYLSAGVRTFKNGEIVADRFCIDRFVGEGGMGEVYAARDLDLGENVALKTLRPHLSANDELLNRFKLEIQTARKVTHPNVCRVFDLFWHRAEDMPSRSPIAFLTMELIEGETLEVRIQRKGKLPKPEALLIVRQIISGLAAAHKAGIVHRDFKSGNILLVGDHGGTRALVTDFGLAQSIDKKANGLPGAVEGTPAYLAPEQLEGGALTVATDIYALGVVLFEVATGTLPFAPVGSWKEAARQRKVAPSPRTRFPQLDKRWEIAITACLAYEPKGRPDSVERVLDTISDRRISRRALLSTAAVGVGAVVSANIWLRPKPLLPEALLSFKRGEDFAQRRNPEGLKQAVVEFERVVKLEPLYAPAWVGLADAYSALGNFDLMDPRVAMQKSKAAASQAIQLDHKSAKAQGILGRVLSLNVREWLTAEPYFRKAVSLDPRDIMIRLWYGSHLGKLGRSKDAFNQIRAGLEQTPSSMSLNQQLATELFRERKLPEFLEAAREVVRLQPFEAGAHVVLARALEWQKEFTEALKSCDQADKLGGGHTAQCFRAAIEIASGNQTGGRRIAADLYRYWSTQPFESSLLASLYAQLNDPETAVAILNRGFERDDSTVLTAACNPYFDSIKNDPRFQKFLQLIGWDKRLTV